jgi:hypothetical protein
MARQPLKQLFRLNENCELCAVTEPPQRPEPASNPGSYCRLWAGSGSACPVFARITAHMGALGRRLCPIGIPEALDLNEMAVRVIRKEVVNPVLGIVSGRTIGISSS